MAYTNLPLQYWKLHVLLSVDATFARSAQESERRETPETTGKYQETGKNRETQGNTETTRETLGGTKKHMQTHERTGKHKKHLEVVRKEIIEPGWRGFLVIMILSLRSPEVTSGFPNQSGSKYLRCCIPIHEVGVRGLVVVLGTDRNRYRVLGG